MATAPIDRAGGKASVSLADEEAVKQVLVELGPRPVGHGQQPDAAAAVTTANATA